MQQSSALRWICAATLAVAAVAPAAADWLVLADGSRVETEGAWEERGAMVVFHLKGGKLSSLRRSDLDLERSRLATKEAAERAAAPPAPAAAPVPKKKPVLVLTDDDVGHYTPEDTPPTPVEGGSATAATAAPAETKPKQRLQVIDFRRDTQATGGVVLVGTMINSSPAVVGDLKVSATLLDEEGKLIANGEGTIGASILQPGQQTTFRIAFPGIYNYATATFETKGYALRTSSSESAAAPGTTPPPG